MPWPDEQPVPGKLAPAKTSKNSSRIGRQPGRVERSQEICVHDGQPRFEAEEQSLQSLHNRPAAGKTQFRKKWRIQQIPYSDIFPATLRRKIIDKLFGNA
jgi:hypothetical protein